MAGPIRQTSPTPSALNRYCGGVIEACWLTAVIAVPLLYNSQGRDGFEPFKAAFLRLFSLVLLAAMTVRLAEGVRLGPAWLHRERSSLRLACAATLLLYCVSILVSTAFSVFPLQSFWGSYHQRQGGLTEFCCLGFSLAVAAELRSEAQIRRLVTALLVPTIPISLVAIMQRAGSDPLRALGAEGGRVFSLEGNPVYLAAYLGMLFPFTILRFLEAAGSDSRGRPLRKAVLAFYAVVGVLQISAFVLAESRGPLLGLVAGVSFLALAHAARASRGRLAGALVVIVSIIGFLAILGIPSGPLAPLARLPVLSRLAGALPRAVPASEGRIDLWNQADRLLISSEPFRYPSGEADRWHALRPLVGYGLETLECVLPQRFSLGSPAPPLMSRFHNRFWDSWYSLGLIGALAYLAMVALAFGAVYQRLNLIQSRSDWVRFWILVLLGVGGLSAGLAARNGPGFLGLGVICGLVLGLASYVAYWGLTSPTARSGPDMMDIRESFLLSSLSALVTNLVETGFAFPVTTTALLCWISIGVAIGLPVCQTEAERTEASRTASQAGRGRVRNVSECIIGAALATILLTFVFIGVVAFEPVAISGVLSASLTRIKFGGGPSYQLELVLLPSWIGAVFAFLADEVRPANGSGWIGAFLIGAFVSGLAGALCATAKAAQISAISSIPQGAAPAAAALAQGRHCEAICLGMMVVCLLLLAAWGWRLCTPGNAGATRSTPRERRTAFAMILAAALLSWFACVNPVRADVLAGLANALNRAGRLPTAIEAYRRALELNANSSAYRFEQAQLLAAVAETSGQRAAFDADMGAAETVEKDGLKISSLDPQGELMLGKIYERWAAGQIEPGRRLALAREARQSFEDALAFSPVAEYALVDLAAVDSIFLGDPAGAADALKRADVIVPDREASNWFDSYAQSSLLSRSPELGRFYAQRAFWCLEKAVEFAKRQHQPMFSLDLRSGILHYRLGELRPALAALQAATTEDHDPGDWQAEGLLAKTLGRLGDRESAISHMTKAVEIAPDQARRPLEEALMEMKTQLSPQSK